MAFATIGTRGIQAQSVDLSSKVTGTLPVPNGGLGIASGTTGQFLKFSGTETLASSAVSAGITGIDTWGLSSSVTQSSGGVNITSNWARRTTDKSSSLGTAMTESSGVFTFPSTGYWLILCNFYFSGNSSTHYRGVIMKNNNGTDLSSSYGHGAGSNPNWDHDAVSVHYNMDVIDTTANTNKIYFQTNAGGTCSVAGGANGQSYVSFIRLGDT